MRIRDLMILEGAVFPMELRQGATSIVLGFGLLSGCTVGASPGRRITHVQWDTVWFSSRTVSDSILPSPSMLTFNHGSLFVYDRATHRLAAFEALTGAVLWVVGGSGQGPEEFAGVSALVPDRDGGVAVVDVRSRRVLRVNSQGRFTGMLPIASMGMQPNQLCVFGEDRFLIADAFDPDPFVMDSTGALIERLDPIWPDFVQEDMQTRQVSLHNDEAGKRCLVALFTGRGFALLFPNREPIVVDYVEAFDPYGVNTRKNEREVEFFAILDAEFVGDTLLVLFAGRTRDEYQLLDRYDGLSGKYLDTYLLPFPTVEIAAGGGMVFAVDSDTMIVALRPRR